ncbi:MAG TPA: hypothetical protein VFP61_12160 [Acidimicrobiales bacterium]|nr:hypothetical protein [Acidimicrobiales bacterium]
MRQAGGWRVVVGPDGVAAVPPGDGVVVVVTDGRAVDLAGLRSSRPGRVAVYVGDPADPEVLAGAAEMAAELGGRPDAVA